MSLTRRSDCGAIGLAQNMLPSKKRKPWGYGDTFFTDEVFIRIEGKQQYPWRAVDQDGEIVDVYLQKRRDAVKKKGVGDN